MRVKGFKEVLQRLCDKWQTFSFSSHSTFPQNQRGGDKERCRGSTFSYRQAFQKNFSEIQGQVEDIEALRSMPEQRGRLHELLQTCPIRIDPSKYQDINDLFSAVASHARFFQRLSESSIRQRLRYARLMANHPVFPVDFRNLRFEEVINHLMYRELNEKCGPNALKHSIDSIRMFLRAYGINPDSWGLKFYRLPPMPKSKPRPIPPPSVVHKMIHFEYSKDPYENALWQYIIAHSFWIGWRVPSEVWQLKVSDIDLESGCIFIREPKKYGSVRQIYPDKVVMTGATRKSFKNWIDKWRPKAENQYSGDFLYIQPSGKPFTKELLRTRLSMQGKKAWKLFQPYVTRHWNAVAMLIRTKIETGHWDIYYVQRWLGHSKVTVTETYVRLAEELYRQFPFDWIKATLQSFGEKGSLSDFSKTSEIKMVLPEIPPCEQNGPGRIRTCDQLVMSQSLYQAELRAPKV